MHSLEKMDSESSGFLEEEIDYEFEPNEREIKDYAKFLGIKLPEEIDLLYLAREGLKAPMPSNWKPYQNRKGDIYYVNVKTNEKMKEHPCDEFYKSLVMKERDKKRNTKFNTKEKNKIDIGEFNGSFGNSSKKIASETLINDLKSNKNKISTFTPMTKIKPTKESLLTDFELKKSIFDFELSIYEKRKEAIKSRIDSHYLSLSKSEENNIEEGKIIIFENLDNSTQYAESYSFISSKGNDRLALEKLEKDLSKKLQLKSEELKRKNNGEIERIKEKISSKEKEIFSLRENLKATLEIRVQRLKAEKLLNLKADIESFKLIEKEKFNKKFEEIFENHISSLKSRLERTFETKLQSIENENSQELTSKKNKLKREYLQKKLLLESKFNSKMKFPRFSSNSKNKLANSQSLNALKSKKSNIHESLETSNSNSNSRFSIKDYFVRNEKFDIAQKRYNFANQRKVLRLQRSAIICSKEKMRSEASVNPLYKGCFKEMRKGLTKTERSLEVMDSRIEGKEAALELREKILSILDGGVEDKKKYLEVKDYVDSYLVKDTIEKADFSDLNSPRSLERSKSWNFNRCTTDSRIHTSYSNSYKINDLNKELEDHRSWYRKSSFEVLYFLNQLKKIIWTKRSSYIN